MGIVIELFITSAILRLVNITEPILQEHILFVDLVVDHHRCFRLQVVAHIGGDTS